MNGFAIKLAENVIVSYLYAVVTLLLLDGADKLTLSAVQTALYAAIPAALAVVKGFLATFVRSPDSPALVE